MEHYFTNNENLKSELRYIKYNYQDYSFLFASDLGVFSKDKIDYGSRVLVESILESDNDFKTILDVGCGYGFIGIVLSKILNKEVRLVDVNKRAVHLTNMNLKENKINGEVILSNIYERVSGSYDLIVTNPPIRAGKKVVLEILENAENFLSNIGELWFVIRKDQGVKSIIKKLENIYKLDIVKKDKGFFVVKAKCY